MGDNTKALEYLLEALQYAIESQTAEYELSVRNNLANIYNANGQFKQAENNYRQIIKVSKNYQDKTLYADALHNLGILYTETAKLNEAIAVFKKALEIYELKQDKKKISQTYLNLGTAYLKKAVNESLKNRIEAQDLSYKYFLKVI